MAKKKCVDLTKADDWMGFYNELFLEKSDRAMALVGAAFLDYRLEEILENFLISEKDVYSNVLNPENSQAILGSFGARITISYAMGLISENERNDLRSIKFIRNRFAHGIHGLTFSDEEIVQRSEKMIIPLKLVADYNSKSARERYVITVAVLSSQLKLRALSSQRERRKVKPDFEMVSTSSITIKGTTDT